MQRIYDILVNILGESKQGRYDRDCTQYQFNCPYCADEKGGVDNKYNLEVSFAIGKFHCWSCNSSGNLSKIIKKYGGKMMLSEYNAVIKDIRESKYYDLSGFSDKEVLQEAERIVLPETFRKIDLRYGCPARLRNYLDKRKITQDIVDKFNLGYTTWDEKNWQDRNRLIIPSYDSVGDLNYWVGRDFTDNPKKTKYKNCGNSDKNAIVFQEGKIQFDSDITLVEGAIDCIYGNNTIAMLGKFVSKDTELYKALKERTNGRIIICLDSDTDIRETKRIYMLLNTGRLRGRIWYIRLGTDILPYKDFGEIYEAEGRKGIIRAIRQAQQFSEVDLLI